MVTGKFMNPFTIVPHTRHKPIPQACSMICAYWGHFNFRPYKM
jgi:hypothetical protein